MVKRVRPMDMQVNIYKLAIKVSQLDSTTQRDFRDILEVLMPGANVTHQTFAMTRTPDALHFLAYFSHLSNRNDWVAEKIITLAQNFDISVTGDL